MENIYNEYIESVVAEWGIGTVSGTFCVCGIVEEFDELTTAIKNINKPEAIISEAGDVLFYIYALRKVFGIEGGNPTSRLSTQKTKSLTISAMKMVNKFVCFSKELDVAELSLKLDLIQSTTVSLATSYCEKFDLTIDITSIFETNLLKLKTRYPSGRRVNHVDKNITQENQNIKEHIYAKNNSEQN